MSEQLSRIIKPDNNQVKFALLVIFAIGFLVHLITALKAKEKHNLPTMYLFDGLVCGAFVGPRLITLLFVSIPAAICAVVCLSHDKQAKEKPYTWTEYLGLLLILNGFSLFGMLLGKTGYDAYGDKQSKYN